MHEVADLALITLAVGFLAVTATVAFFAWRIVKRVRRWRVRLEALRPWPAPGPMSTAPRSVPAPSSSPARRGRPSGCGATCGRM